MAFNSTVNSTTGYSPYFIIHGRHCRLPFDSVVGSTATDKELPEWVREHLERLGVVYDAAAAKLKINALHRQRVFDLRRDVRMTFRPGDRVLVLKGKVVDGTLTKSEFATEGPYLGPFTVQRALERDNYQLTDLQTRRMYDVVHVERLVPYPSTPRATAEESSDYYAIRSVVDKRIKKSEHADRALKIPKGTPTLEYRVRWVGFGPASDSWRSPHYLGDIKELIDAYEKRTGGQAAEPFPVHSRDAAIDIQPSSLPGGKRHFRARPEPAAAQTPIEPASAPVESSPVEAQQTRRNKRQQRVEATAMLASSSQELCAHMTNIYQRLFGG